MKSEPKIVVLYNPVLHLKRQRLYKRLQQKLPASAVTVESTGCYAEDLARLKAQCADANLLVAVGGDGTLNLAVNAIAETDTLLGVVPAGSGNDFARIWVAGLSADQIIETALNGRPMTIDLGKVNERYFLNAAGMGFDAHLVKKLKHKTWPRGLSYVAKALTLLPLYRAQKLSFSIDEEPPCCEVKTFMLTFGNGRYFGGGIPITPHARINDGALAYCHIPESNRIGSLWRLLRVLTRRQFNTEKIATGQLSRAAVESEGLPIQGDGEDFGHTPARIEVCVAALKINKP